MAMIPDEDLFGEEVLGLFALEAREWINQSNMALQELEQEPPSERKIKLYETIICAITNLGGSAATIELPVLEQLAFSMLPLLQVVRDHGGNISVEQQAALREGLSSLISAIQNLNETKAGAIEGLEHLLKKLADAACLPVPPAQVTQQSASSSPSRHAEESLDSAPSLNILEALRDFQRVRAVARDSNRHMAEAVLKAAGIMDQGNGKTLHIDEATVLKILRHLDEVDEEFLAELRQRLLRIGAVISDLKSPHAEVLMANGRLEALLHEVHELHERARALEAKELMLFFHGLQTFLVLWSKKTIPISIERLKAVELRLNDILPLAQQWAEAGRGERASIEKLVLHY